MPRATSQPVAPSSSSAGAFSAAGGGGDASRCARRRASVRSKRAGRAGSLSTSTKRRTLVICGSSKTRDSKLPTVLAWWRSGCPASTPKSAVVSSRSSTVT
jgi:hypothetical protein